MFFVKLHQYIFQKAVVRPAKYFSVKDKWPYNCARVVTVSTGMTYTISDTTAESQSSNENLL